VRKDFNDNRRVLDGPLPLSPFLLWSTSFPLGLLPSRMAAQMAGGWAFSGKVMDEIIMMNGVWSALPPFFLLFPFSHSSFSPFFYPSPTVAFFL